VRLFSRVVSKYQHAIGMSFLATLPLLPLCKREAKPAFE
jgi:hypothetical protein